MPVVIFGSSVRAGLLPRSIVVQSSRVIATHPDTNPMMCQRVKPVGRRSGKAVGMASTPRGGHCTAQSAKSSSCLWCVTARSVQQCTGSRPRSRSNPQGPAANDGPSSLSGRGIMVAVLPLYSLTDRFLSRGVDLAQEPSTLVLRCRGPG
jgi:hypothetical protein